MWKDMLIPFGLAAGLFVGVVAAIVLQGRPSPGQCCDTVFPLVGMLLVLSSVVVHGALGGLIGSRLDRARG